MDGFPANFWFTIEKRESVCYYKNNVLLFLAFPTEPELKEKEALIIEWEFCSYFWYTL